MNTLDSYVIAQDCPTCGATYGEPCHRLRSNRGQAVARMHIGRYYAHWAAWIRMHENESQAVDHWLKRRHERRRLP